LHNIRIVLNAGMLIKKLFTGCGKYSAWCGCLLMCLAVAT